MLLLSLNVYSREVFLPWMEWLMLNSIHTEDDANLHFSATDCSPGSANVPARSGAKQQFTTEFLASERQRVAEVINWLALAQE